jgi:hypothetical protein
MRRATALTLVASAFSLLMAPLASAQTDYPNRAITMAVAPAPEQQPRAYLRNLVAGDVDRWAKVITDAQISIAD